MRGIPVSAEQAPGPDHKRHQRSRQMSPTTKARRRGSSRKISLFGHARSARRSAGSVARCSPSEIITLAAIGHGSDQNRLVRPEIIAGIGLRQFAPKIALDGHKIEHRRCEIRESRALPGRPRFAPWRALSGKPPGAITAEPKLSSTPPSSRSTECAKIRKSRIARRADRRAIAVGMFVQNVVADPDMNRDGHRHSIGRRQNAPLAIRIIARSDASPDVFAQALSPRAPPRMIHSFSSPVSRQSPNSPLRM